MYILLAIPVTYKHYVSGIEPSHTQKRYKLNLPYEDTSSSWPEILHIEPSISCDLHWGNMTCKREEAIALKFYTTLLPMSVRVIWKEEMAGIVEAHHAGAGRKTKGTSWIHAGKWGRPDQSQKQITVTFHTRAALAAIHCDPVVSPNSYSTVCNMTRATRLHRSPITMSDAASLNMHSAAIAAAATNKALQWDR